MKSKLMFISLNFFRSMTTIVRHCPGRPNNNVSTQITNSGRIAVLKYVSQMRRQKCCETLFHECRMQYGQYIDGRLS